MNDIANSQKNEKSIAITKNKGNLIKIICHNFLKLYDCPNSNLMCFHRNL